MMESTPRLSQQALLKGRDIVIFDLETQLSSNEVGGWHNTHLMRMSLGVIYERLKDQYKTYHEDKVCDLLHRLKEAELIVGFNQKHFDYAVLQAYTGDNLTELVSLDLLEEIYKKLGFRLSLGNLASATLGIPKMADGLTALRWWKEGKIKEIEEYCRQDVELTSRLFDYVLEHGYLIYEHKIQGRVRLSLDWSLENWLGLK